MSARRLQILLIATAMLALVALAIPSLVDAVRSRALAGVRLVPAPLTAPPVSTSAAPAAVASTTTSLPARPKELYVLSDSVVLDVRDELASRLPDWTITVEGDIGLTVDQAGQLLERRTHRVAPTVIVAVGYNSIWERNRRNYDHWAAQFDAQADRIVAQLRSLGAQEIVWVTVRELDEAIVPGGWKSQLPRYGFYFPYVNERLRALPQRNPDVRLADWSAASQQLGLTRDAIHVTPQGADLLVDVITAAAGIPARTHRRTESEHGRDGGGLTAHTTAAARARRTAAVDSSAGRNDSTESSARVMSTAVPKVATVLHSDSTSSPTRSRSGRTSSDGASTWWRASATPGYSSTSSRRASRCSSPVSSTRRCSRPIT